MKKKKVMVVNKLGLHARTSAQFVGLANQFPCDVQLTRDDETVNGKSMMAILTLAAGKGAKLTIQTNGESEKKALSALCDLVNTGFGEKQ